MNINYGWEKYHFAVLCLVSRTSSLRERLVDAFLSHLHKLQQDDSVIPRELWGKHNSILKRANTVDASSGQGSLVDSLNLLNEEELTILAENILSVYDGIVRRMEYDP